MTGLLNLWDSNMENSYFIYGGSWMADFHEPAGVKQNMIFGKSTNQAMINASDDSNLEVGDFVFLRPSLKSVTQALHIARRAAALSRQNITLAIVYNMVAIPFAIFGFVTPLFAAIAMSSSSLLVIVNAMRIRGIPRRETA